MKIALNSLKKYLDFDLPPLGELIDMIGSQLGAVEEVLELGKIYQGAVVAKVVSCQPIDGTDHLSICKIDDHRVAKDVERDNDGLIQVVCGAPNVREGLIVVWLPPGSVVPATIHKEPLTLEAKTIHGVKSNGMLASPRELALGENHDGIMELPADLKVGSGFSEAVGLKDEVIIDIENKMFTHRPDCFGSLGIAREVAGILGKPFVSPDWYIPQPKLPEPTGQTLNLSVKNELPNLVPRFAALVVRDVKLAPSPLWLQLELIKLGQKPINNVVDLTNYYMQLSGQPLHAYDYDKVAKLSGSDGASLIVRNPKPGEQLTLLNGKSVKPGPEVIVIATNQTAIGLGGVMGGAETEVSIDTKNIILECATFDMYSIRRTAMTHGLFTDAVTRYTKGQSPLQNLAVLTKLTTDLIDLTSGQVASQFIDDNHLDKTILDRGYLNAPVQLSVVFVSERLGLKLTDEEVARLLKNVEFKVEIDNDEVIISAPFWRTDIEQREDIVEEVGRLYGLDKIPLTLPSRDLTPAATNDLLEAKDSVRGRLAKAGANEVLTYSFVPGSLLDKTGQDKSRAFAISNALSPSLQYYRLSLMPSLLGYVHPNIKAGFDQFALFELGKTHGLDNGNDEEGLPREFEFTALVVTAADKLKLPGAAYYQARRFLTELIEGEALVFKPITDEMKAYPVVQPYDTNRAALVSLADGTFLGIIGEFKTSVTRGLKLPTFTAGFEVDTTVLAPIISAVPSYSPLARFPSVLQDITLKVDVQLSFEEVYKLVETEAGANAPEASHVSLEPLGIYQDAQAKDSKNITFRLRVTGLNRTLTDSEVNKVLDNVADAARDKFGAQRI